MAQIPTHGLPYIDQRETGGETGGEGGIGGGCGTYRDGQAALRGRWHRAPTQAPRRGAVPKPSRTVCPHASMPSQHIQAEDIRAGAGQDAGQGPVHALPSDQPRVKRCNVGGGGAVPGCSWRREVGAGALPNTPSVAATSLPVEADAGALEANTALDVDVEGAESGSAVKCLSAPRDVEADADEVAAAADVVVEPEDRTPWRVRRPTGL